jgi:hypothetical protein
MRRSWARRTTCHGPAVGSPSPSVIVTSGIIAQFEDRDTLAGLSPRTVTMARALDALSNMVAIRGWPVDVSRTCYRRRVPPQPVLTRIPQGQLLDADRLPPEWRHAAVLCADDRWHPVTIVAWCRYRQSWAVLLRWPDGHQDWRVHDPHYLRRLRAT